MVPLPGAFPCSHQAAGPKGEDGHTPLPVGKPDHPVPTPAVGFVFPHGLDAVLEEVVVGPGGQLTGRLDVVVHTPEVLRRMEWGLCLRIACQAGIPP